MWTTLPNRKELICWEKDCMRLVSKKNILGREDYGIAEFWLLKKIFWLSINLDTASFDSDVKKLIR
jgi:hypothetical protein